jgi:hypothetical protein
MIVEALAANTSITNLHFNGTTVPSVSRWKTEQVAASFEVFAPLAKALRVNKTLKHLEIYQGGI